MNKSYDYYYDKEIIPTDLQLCYCGYSEDCEPDHNQPPHIRHCWLVVLVTKGECIFTCNNINYTVKTGEVFIIYPNIVTSYKNNSTPPWQHCWFAFKGQFAEYLLPEKARKYVCPIKKFDEFKNQIYSLTDFLTEHESTRPFTVQSYIYRLFDILQNDVLTYKNQATKMYVEKAVQFIMQNYFKQISTRDIAEHVNLDRTHFSRIFKKHTGTSPLKYIIDFRINIAANLLETTNSPASEVAKIVGFPNINYFFRTFHQIKSKTPNEYRLGFRI